MSDNGDQICPYKTLPDSSYWRRGVSNVAPTDMDLVVAPKFKIDQADKLATAGSCFAQHISRYVAKSGYDYFVTEPGHPVLDDACKRSHSYGMFSARYGNIYTTRQLLQTLHRAYGLAQAVDDVWQREGRYFDPFRPVIQPDGFASLAEFHADRNTHYAAIRKLVEETNVFVFTLGLTETWLNADDGFAYAGCPGCGSGRHDATRHIPHNLTVTEVIDDLHEAIEFMVARNPGLKVLLTVSPVPLIATFEPAHVMTATTYSKSVLRVAAQTVADTSNNIDYFPSYEMITGQYIRGQYFEDDLREVRPEGVDHVMQTFFRHYLGRELGDETRTGSASSNSEPDRPSAPEAASAGTEPPRSANDVICEEEVLFGV